MPGIVGLLTRMPRARAEAELSLMVEALRHETDYETGTWIDEHSGVYVGWIGRRNSVAAQMPLRNEQGDVVLVFSGEEYPDPDTVCRLKRRGHVVGPQSSSYLVHLAEEYPGFPANLNGRFQGLLTARSEGVATLFNDRYGIHRLYYHESRDAFYFAAEAKAILGVRPELRTVDPRGLGEFVACGCVLENRTLFTGVHVLPPGASWVFRQGTLERKGPYFEPREWEQQAPLDEEAYYEALREIFSRNLPRYFGGPGRIAMSLTGGLDSRMIMAWQKSAPGTLPCFSFGSLFRENHDVQVARKVAKACGQSYQVIELGHEFLARFPQYAETFGFFRCAPGPAAHLLSPAA